MAVQIQWRRGSSTQNDAFTGALGEITVDTTNDSLRIHDGSTLGGFEPNAKYADLAERYETDVELENGEVVVIGGMAEITRSTVAADTKVLGVVSTKPSHKMNAYAGDLKTRDKTHPFIALTGRCPCKVVGPVNRGDFIVSSSVPGHGMRSEQYIGGAVIGKSLTAKEGDEPGVIEIAVGRF